MSYLLYCILPSRASLQGETLAGVHGQPVHLIKQNGLGAAVSAVTASDPGADIFQLLTYKTVVESLHRHSTVIPMRYGCLFNGKSQVVGLLETRCREYRALLRELEGCVEMGIRILTAEWGMRNAESTRKIQNLRPQISGRDYLAARREQYARQEQAAKENGAVLARCRGAFAGLFVKCKMDLAPLRTPRSAFHLSLPSLYFLVPGNCLETFHNEFRRLSARESAKLLLSGPWPPYSFAQLEGNLAGGQPYQRGPF
ncbi:MAG: GvpL/GvpF family gas vesicle protein [Syntrophobacteria bacterium]